ncbi:DUF7546 family protein [Halorussus caseinilyticus]|uniref:ABC transporter ATP-binding protein n=1 Tax=Halorussus caseinilyticus TaxID=3034025 RepID=A0ABD5WM39_9EURY|nr:hypothetical protein [Halorussus sp. DT72]
MSANASPKSDAASESDAAPDSTPSLGTAARAARAFVALTVGEALVVLTYLAVADAGVLSVRHLAYPFVWTNAAVLAVAYARIPRPSDRWTYGALAVGAGYFAVLCAAGGLAAAGHGAGLGSVSVVGAVPGWGPLVVVSGGAVHLTLVPFKLVGYAGLATLAYAALARASRGLLGGALGLVTCVSCTGSVLAALFAGVGGSSAAISAATARSYDLSTAVFLLAVGAMWVGLRR